MALSPVTIPLTGTGKTVQPTTTEQFGTRKCRRTNAAKDRISMLPDDVLVSILSLLKLKEAATTCVLSNRWRYLWTSTRCLDFCDLIMIQARPREESLSILCRRFIDFVNKVLTSHHGPTIDEFKINFHVNDNECYKFDMENWIKFALERGVKTLELSFSGFYGRFDLLCPALTTQFLRNYRLDSIKALRLHKVRVTEQVVDYLLSHCPSLEFLYMWTGNSISFVNLKVSGPSLRLKHLEINASPVLKTIEISDIGLVFFKYTGQANVHFKDVPHLAEVSLNGKCAFFFLYNRWLFSTLLSQLETFVFYLNGLNSSFLYRESDQWFLKFPPKLTNLRKLDFKLESFSSINLVRGTSLLMVLLDMSPLLHTLVLEFVGLRRDDTSYCRWLIESNNVPKANRPHQCLKVFELVGFVGREVDIEVAKNIFKIAVSLEKIIIDSSPSLGADTVSPEYRSTVRTRARQLETVLPLGAKLVIL